MENFTQTNQSKRVKRRIRSTLFFLSINFIAAVLAFNTANAYAQLKQPTVFWAENFGGTGSFLYQSGTKVAADAQKNVCMTGFIQGIVNIGSHTFSTNGGSMDVLVAKFDESGNVIWASSFGGDGLDYGYGIDTDSEGNTYVSGFFAGTVTLGSETFNAYSWRDFFIMKYNSTGEIQWFHHGGGSFAESLDLEVDTQGNIFLAALYYDLIEFDNSSLTFTGYGESDILVLKYSSEGDLLWAKNAGSFMQDAAMGIATDKDGNAYITGFFIGTVEFGTTTLISASEWEADGFIWKLNPDGEHQWAIAVGGESSETLFDITCEPNGNTYATGSFASESILFGNDLIQNIEPGYQDAFIVKTSADGTPVWARSGGGIDQDYGRDVTIDEWGNPIIAGNFTGEAQFGSQSLLAVGNDDAYMLKYDTNGNELWSLTGSGALSECVEGVIAGPENTYYITGYFYETMTIGGMVMNSISDQDIFLVQVKEPWSVNSNLKKISKTIYVFPNPSSDHIQLKGLDLLKEKSYMITIFSADGRAVLTEKAYTQSSPIDISKLSSGIYLVKISDGDTIVTSTRFIKP